MANINLYDAYNQKRRKFGLNDSARFRSSFVDAVNFSFAEFNNLVFGAETLGQIGSFDDVIDERLSSFLTLTFDASPTSEVNDAISNREFWAAEWDFERLSDTNGFTDTITDGSGVVLSIADGVSSVVGGSVSATVALPSADTFTLRFESTEDGNALLVNGVEVSMTYTDGDEDTTQSIVDVTEHVIDGVSGYTLNRTRFLTSATAIYDFLINEGTGVTITDVITAANTTPYTAELDATAVWKTVYIEPSSGLSTRYSACLDMGLDYHLQDGGEWALEPEPERERKWYGRGIKDARNLFQQIAPYGNPLGI
jgi:hypothetical protein